MNIFNEQSKFLWRKNELFWKDIFPKCQIIHLVNSWEDFFDKDLTLPTHNDTTFEARLQINTAKTSVWIYNCLFKGISADKNGAGVNYIPTSQGKLLVESSIFESCTLTTNKIGGGLYAECECVINRVCGVNCSTKGSGSFSYVDATGGDINSIYETSIAGCRAESYRTMYHIAGYIEIKSLNNSHNKGNSAAGIRCDSCKKESHSFETSIKFSSFAHDNVSNQYIVRFHYAATSTKVNEMMFCNVIYNNGKNVICTAGTTTISNSCIMKNEGQTVFQTASGGFTLINCSVDENINSIGGSSPETGEIGGKSFIYGFEFLDTGSCVNTFDTITNVPLIFLYDVPERTYFVFNDDRDFHKDGISKILEYIIVSSVLPLNYIDKFWFM